MQSPIGWRSFSILEYVCLVSFSLIDCQPLYICFVRYCSTGAWIPRELCEWVYLLVIYCHNDSFGKRLIVFIVQKFLGAKIMFCYTKVRSDSHLTKGKYRQKMTVMPIVPVWNIIQTLIYRRNSTIEWQIVYCSISRLWVSYIWYCDPPCSLIWGTWKCGGFKGVIRMPAITFNKFTLYEIISSYPIIALSLLYFLV